MKHYYFVLLAVMSYAGHSQIVNIPDPAFKAKLIESTALNSIAYDAADQYLKVDANNNGEIEVSEALAVKRMTLNYNNNQILSLTGIKSFANMTELVMGNMYDSFTSLDVSNMTSLTQLVCQCYGLTNLNVSGSGLVKLKCDSGNLTSLDVSSATSLTYLDCHQNELTSLLLPPSIQYLKCDGNQLASLDLAPFTNLSELRCYVNDLTSLTLPISLTILDCSDNNLGSLNMTPLLLDVNCRNNVLTSLGPLPNGIKYLNCEGNLLTNLNISDKPELIQLDCGYNLLTDVSLYNTPVLYKFGCEYNQLVSFDASMLGPSINSIKIDHNQLTNLILPAVSTGDVDCSFNFLTELDVRKRIGFLRCQSNNLVSISAIAGVTYLDCRDNQLTTLLTGPTNYNTISCSNNQLVNIDISQTTTVKQLYCDNNNLNSLTIKKLLDFYSFTGNPNLAYICAHPDQVAEMQATVAELNYATEVNSLCTFVAGGFYHIAGEQRFNGSSGNCSDNNPYFPNLKYQINSGTTSATYFFDDSGLYDIAVTPGTYTLTPLFSQPYFNVSPQSTTVAFPTVDTPFVQDFCISPNSIHPDLEVRVTPRTAAVPGFDATYRVRVKNKGTQSETAIISLQYDDTVLDFVDAEPSVASQTFGIVSWNVTNLPVFGTAEFLVSFNLNSPVENPALNLGDKLKFIVSAPLSNDDTPDDNVMKLKQVVVDGLDPNDKTCLEGSPVESEMIGKYLHYMIRFENTGNYPAQNIVVRDNPSLAKFDISSLEPLEASHPFYTRVTDGNKIEFVFDNIMLPFEEGSNGGYILFRIKTLPTLVTGNSVSNTAKIYFNYNPPIITNTATTTFTTMGVGVGDTASLFSIWPNPVADELHIDSKTAEVQSVSIFDLMGREVMRVKGSGLENIDVSKLTSGEYLLKVTSAGFDGTVRFLKK